MRDVEIKYIRSFAERMYSSSEGCVSLQNGHDSSSPVGPAKGASVFISSPTSSVGCDPMYAANDRLTRRILCVRSCTTMKSLMASMSSTHCFLDRSIWEKRRKFSIVTEA